MNRTSSNYLWPALALIVALGYLFGLGGDHIPRNGDELVYAHIARLTAASGHWLPLVSSYDSMRNTKPPLLFWQAMVAGDWGNHWTLLRLRLPSIAYTWAIALMVGLLTWKIICGAYPDDTAGARGGDAHPQRGHAISMGAIAAIVYLSFFTSYRYGRPYMTSAPETFWLFGIFFALAWSPAKLLASRWMFPLLAGLALGIGSLYKSFAMVVPAGFALALCYQGVGARKPLWNPFRPGVFADGFKVLAICALGLGLFGLWFALDPQPGDVWNEFVVGENAGKFKSSPGYLKVAFSGSGFITILTGYFSNALFLLPVSIGCMVAAWKAYRKKIPHKKPMSDAEKIMWLWMLALALVFLFPNQRSTRYLIPAMPALAVLMALYWKRTGRLWFGLSLLLCAVGALAMGWIAYAAVRATGDASLYSPAYWVFIAVTVVACVAGMFKQGWTRPVTALAGFAVLFALAWATEPFNGDLGRFKPATNALLQGQTVAVPSNFNGHFERYEFIITGAKVVPYFAEQPVDYADVESLLKTHRYALVQRRVGQVPCTDCRVIDMRWDLRSRQDEKDGTKAAFKTPETYFYAQEYLVERLVP
jgi:4-amino-4-deoxy-L-arabinose transferase-like glycosyltransferase